MRQKPIAGLSWLSHSLRGIAMTITIALAGCAAEPDGPELYAQWCSECHGPAGRGDPYRRSLSPGLDLQRSTAIQTRSTGWLYRTIRHGYNAMPGFDHQLEHPEIESLVDYTIELVSPPPR